MQTSFLLLAVAFAVAHSSNSTTKPSIIVLFADDFAFDLGCFGSPTSLTPNIDKMRSEGVKFTQWLSGENICSPSRASLLTGRHAIRTGVYGNMSKIPAGTGDHRVFHPNSYGHLADEELTLPEMLRDHAGYATGMVSDLLAHARSGP